MVDIPDRPLRPAPTGIVFIDPRVPDLQDLLSGLKPGQEACVLNPDSDGLRQIAAVLATDGYQDLATISIVGHGTDGAMRLGSATLSDATLASHTLALGTIGAALRAGGDLQLYGCDVAGDATGRRFIGDLSNLAGGAAVAAATHPIGAAAAGAGWSLDASTAPINVSDPFTAAAEASYQGVLAIASSAAASAPAATPSKYFLLIDGLQGGATDSAHVGWFEVGSFNFEAFSELASGGLSSGQPMFSALEVSLSRDPDLAGALAGLATGKRFTSIKLEGVVANGTGTAPVYDLTLANVALTGLQQDTSGNDSLTFDGYQQLGLVTMGQQPDGSLVPADSFGFNLATSTAIDPAGLPAPSVGSSVPATTPTQYFLLIDGLKGGSTNSAHVGWFEVQGFGFAASSVLAAGGLSSGQPMFAPLEVSLSRDPDLARALADIATGRRFTSIKLEGVAVNGSGAAPAVYDLTLANVALTGVQQDSGGNDILTFGGYQQLGLVTKGQQPDGSLVQADSFGFDLHTLTTISPTGLPTPSVGTSAPAATPTRYFLLIDGLKGGSVDSAHVGWFEVQNFSFGVSSALGSGGLTSSKPSFSPLEVSLGGDPTRALADLATGTRFTSIKLEGVVANPTGPELAVYDLTLANVALTGLQQTSSGNDSLTFGGYQQLGLVTMGRQPDGSLVAADSFGFNLATNTAIDPTGLPTPSVGSSVPAATPGKYFLLIDGLNGGSTDSAHAGWFDVQDFSFDAAKPLLSGGLTSGRVAFSPLQVSLGRDPDLAGALADLATGTRFTSIKLEGVAVGGSGAAPAVYDLTLANVALTGLQQDSGSGNDFLTFDGYQQLGLVTMGRQPDGSLAQADSFGFDLHTLTTISPTGLPTPSVGTSAPAATRANTFC